MRVLIPLTDKRKKAYNKSDKHGKYESGDLKASGSSGGESGQPWRGIDPGHRHWAPPRVGRGRYAEYIVKHFIPNYAEIESVHARLDALDEAGLIIWSIRGKPRLKRYLTPDAGMPPQSLWNDIDPPRGDEDKGYPTQKPVKLLQRIIQASSDKDDIVLDPFCGCATTMVAADRENRNWIGIDISPKAAELVIERIRTDQGMFEDIIARDDIPKRTDLGNVLRYNAPENKTKLYGEQAGNCNGCGEHFQTQHLEIDHIIAESVGGTDHIENLQLLCGHCNRIKGNRGQEYLLSRLNKD